MSAHIAKGEIFTALNSKTNSESDSAVVGPTGGSHPHLPSNLTESVYGCVGAKILIQLPSLRHASQTQKNFIDMAF